MNRGEGYEEKAQPVFFRDFSIAADHTCRGHSFEYTHPRAEPDCAAGRGTPDFAGKPERFGSVRQPAGLHHESRRYRHESLCAGECGVFDAQRQKHGRQRSGRSDAKHRQTAVRDKKKAGGSFHDLRHAYLVSRERHRYPGWGRECAGCLCQKRIAGANQWAGVWKQKKLEAEGKGRHSAADVCQSVQKRILRPVDYHGHPAETLVSQRKQRSRAVYCDRSAGNHLRCNAGRPGAPGSVAYFCPAGRKRLHPGDFRREAG